MRVLPGGRSRGKSVLRVVRVLVGRPPQRHSSYPRNTLRYLKAGLREEDAQDPGHWPLAFRQDQRLQSGRDTEVKNRKAAPILDQCSPPVTDFFATLQGGGPGSFATLQGGNPGSNTDRRKHLAQDADTFLPSSRFLLGSRLMWSTQLVYNPR